MKTLLQKLCLIFWMLSSFSGISKDKIHFEEALQGWREAEAQSAASLAFEELVYEGVAEFAAAGDVKQVEAALHQILAVKPGNSFATENLNQLRFLQGKYRGNLIWNGFGELREQRYYYRLEKALQKEILRCPSNMAYQLYLFEIQHVIEETNERALRLKGQLPSLNLAQALQKVYEFRQTVCRDCPVFDTVDWSDWLSGEAKDLTDMIQQMERQFVLCQYDEVYQQIFYLAPIADRVKSKIPANILRSWEEHCGVYLETLTTSGKFWDAHQLLCLIQKMVSKDAHVGYVVQIAKAFETHGFNGASYVWYQYAYSLNPKRTLQKKLDEMEEELTHELKFDLKVVPTWDKSVPREISDLFVLDYLAFVPSPKQYPFISKEAEMKAELALHVREFRVPENPEIIDNKKFTSYKLGRGGEPEIVTATMKEERKLATALIDEKLTLGNEELHCEEEQVWQWVAAGWSFDYSDRSLQQKLSSVRVPGRKAFLEEAMQAFIKEYYRATYRHILEQLYLKHHHACEASVIYQDYLQELCRAYFYLKSAMPSRAKNYLNQLIWMD